MGSTGIGPVADLVAVDPRGHMGAISYERHREPLAVFGDDPPCILAAKEAASAAIFWFGRIAARHAVVDLAFVAHHEVTRYAAKENA